MKSTLRVAMLAGVVLSLSLLASSAHGGVRVVRGYRGYYAHPRYVHYRAYPRYYHGHGGWFSFGFSRVYTPAPVYVAPPPVIYHAPPVVVGPPVVVQSPVVVQPPVVASQDPPPPPSAPVFVETARRYHKHGDNEGKLDWVEGLIEGRAVRYYYDDFGRLKKEKWLD